MAGTEAVDAEEIRVLADIPVGTNIWDIDLDAVRARINRHAWIADADVRRWLPNSLVVAVEEHRPIAALRVGDTPWAVDEHGRLFAPLPADVAHELTQISGVELLEAQTLDARTMYLLRRVAALHHCLHRRHPLTEIQVHETKGLTVRTEDLGDLPIHVGWGHWRRKCRRLDAVLTLWRGREDHLHAVSLAFDDQVVVRVRSGVAMPAKPAPVSPAETPGEDAACAAETRGLGA